MIIPKCQDKIIQEILNWKIMIPKCQDKWNDGYDEKLNLD